jgi:hypothetical protein
MASVVLLPMLFKPGIAKLNVSLSLELGFTLFAAYQCQSRELVTESASEGVYVNFARSFTGCSPSFGLCRKLCQTCTEGEIERNSCPIM